MKHYLLSTLILFSAPAAFAEDAETQGSETDDMETLPAEGCFPVEGVRDTLLKFDSLKATKRDRVGPDLSLKYTLEDGEVMPERHEIRDGDRIIPVLFDEDLRSIGLADHVRGVSETAQFCTVDPSREGRSRDARGYTVNLSMGVRFKETPGQHSMEEIEDGLKDGRSHYKKMAGAMGFMVPKFDHIAVAGDDDDNPPRVWAVAKGEDIGEPAFEQFDNARMIDIDTLEEMGADAIRVEGSYRMSPSPDAKTVAKFSGDD